MRSLLSSVFLGLASIALAFSAQAAPVVGQPAPDFSLTDAAGKTVRLSDFKGKHVVLEWTNPACPFVRKHYGSTNMQTLQKEAATSGVVWLSINSTATDHGDYLKPEQLGRWMAEQKASPVATLLDESGATGKAYGARTTPHMYIVGPQGQLLYAGGIDSIASSRPEDIKTAVNYVRQGLSEVLAGKPISVPASKPYGCSVKYKS
ncbi:MAG: thioredoxin family protein [Rhodoferax sp.]|nr:thioredoxin family protein [Rhodoferax sp.]